MPVRELTLILRDGIIILCEQTMNGGGIVAWSYNHLWKMLIDKKMKRTDLLSTAHINTKTLSRMGKEEPISMDALGKICKAFCCRIEDIVEYVPDEEDSEAEEREPHSD